MSGGTAALAAARSRWGRTALRTAAGPLLPAALLIAWQLAATSGTCTRSQLPPPEAVLEAARSLLGRGELQHHIAISVQRVLIGFAIGASLGLTLGGLVGLSRTARAVLGPTAQAIRAVPSLAWSRCFCCGSASGRPRRSPWWRPGPSSPCTRPSPRASTTSTRV